MNYGSFQWKKWNEDNPSDPCLNRFDLGLFPNVLKKKKNIKSSWKPEMYNVHV